MYIKTVDQQHIVTYSSARHVPLSTPPTVCLTRAPASRLGWLSQTDRYDHVTTEVTTSRL